jgi:hypothetical protein
MFCVRVTSRLAPVERGSEPFWRDIREILLGAKRG